MWIGFSIFALIAALPLGGMGAAVWVLAFGQLSLVINEIRKRQVTGAGAFLFMSFLFFGMRPLYLLVESDYRLLIHIFRVGVDWNNITSAMWWATLAVVCFSVGAQLAPRLNSKKLRRRVARNLSETVRPLVTQNMAYALLLLQAATVPVMMVLASGFGRSLYGSALGAYAYDAPVPMQAVHVFTLVVLLERYLRNRSPFNILMIGVSGLLFLYFTWLMRDVSNFRGFYLTGVMVAGIALLQRLKPRVSYAWLIIPIMVAQPFFQYLGTQRSKANEQLAEQGIVEEVFQDRGVLMAYWDFYRQHGGDMNIFDTFVAAKQAEPKFRPYVWSWLYVPLHFVPRAIWEGKPARGITQDVSYNRGAPLSPGIAGFFLLDGGLLWMLGSMLLLGYLVSSLDWYVLTMPRGYLQCCLIGIVTINAMFLTRFYLWQYFYQVLYAAIPCIVLAWYFNKRAARPNRRAPSFRGTRVALSG